MSSLTITGIDSMLSTCSAITRPTFAEGICQANTWRLLPPVFSAEKRHVVRFGSSSSRVRVYGICRGVWGAQAPLSSLDTSTE